MYRLVFSMANNDIEQKKNRNQRCIIIIYLKSQKNNAAYIVSVCRYAIIRATP